MDLRFLRLRRWLLKQQPNKTVFNRLVSNVFLDQRPERILGKRPWVSRSEEIIEDNTPKLEDMSEEVRQAQAEHEASVKENNNTESDNKDDETNQNA